jgi:hypothetical protein
MDCKTARLLLELHRPWSPELGDEDLDSLRGHVADCLECAAVQRADRPADEVLGQAMRAVPVPEGLRDRILSRLANRRDRWYQRRVLRWSIASAAALLLLSIGWAWWHRPVALDVDKQAKLANDLPDTADKVVQWFQDHEGVTVQVPPNFNYRFLTQCALPRLQNVDNVPMVVLIAPNRAVLRIYILDPVRFDMSKLDGQPHGSGNFTVITMPPTETDRFGYLLEYSGGNIESFRYLPDST